MNSIEQEMTIFQIIQKSQKGSSISFHFESMMVLLYWLMQILVYLQEQLLTM